MNNSHERYLAELKTFFADTHVCRDCFRLLVHFSIRLAAVGHADQVLTMVERSPEANLFTPLAGGLRLYLGRPDDTVGHAHELAREVATQIREATTEFAYDQTAVPAA
ncbi:MAG: hypothetical protein ABSE59_01860 [Opitutaceae bacterium]|jgi:predicted dithiol-disulfide oxidoreductase (DUF899 family)